MNIEDPSFYYVEKSDWPTTLHPSCLVGSVLVRCTGMDRRSFFQHYIVWI